MLDLRFEGTLADSSTKAASMTMQKGVAAYGAGISGQAFNLNGSNAIDLGTAAYLQPADLTASFWYKPNAAMSGEQVFTWSKTVYNSDGWYLTSESEHDAPRAVDRPRRPASRTRSPSTRRAPTSSRPGSGRTSPSRTTRRRRPCAFYRNGVKQVSTVKYAATGTATGVLGSEATSVKTIGFNGPGYNGAHANGLLDDYQLYNGVATIADIVSLTQANNPAFDPATVAQGAVDALRSRRPPTTSFGVPTQAANGAQFVWTSTNTDVIDIENGQALVVRPDSAPATVTLMASATYGGSAPVTKSFAVTVAPTGSTASIYLEDTELDEVMLDDDYLVNSNQKMIEYLLSLDPERFLVGFKNQAGIATTAQPYGGWERTSGTRFQGHFFGHYISALSQAYATTTDATVKAQLLGKLTTSVDGLAQAQAAYAAANPANAGYVSPFPVTYLPHGSDGLLVPFYNLHKVLAGLLAAHEHGPAAARRRRRSTCRERLRHLGARLGVPPGEPRLPAQHRVRRHERGAVHALRDHREPRPQARRRVLRRGDAVPAARGGHGRAQRQAREHDDPEARRRAQALHGVHRQPAPVRDAHGGREEQPRDVQDGRRELLADRGQRPHLRQRRQQPLRALPRRRHAVPARDQRHHVGLRRELHVRGLQRVQHAEALAGALPGRPGREVRGLLRVHLHQHDPGARRTPRPA